MRNSSALVLFMLLSFYSCISQQIITYQGENFVTGILAYQNNDSLEFVHNKDQYSVEKPNLIFLQGSLPRPVIFEMNDSTSVIAPLSNFHISRLLKSYNVFILSKPFTPLRVPFEELNLQYLYVPDTTNPSCYDTNYKKTNYLEYTSKRISYFVDYVHDKYKSKSENFILIGHSQGAVEAARVSSMNKKITHTVLSSANPLGRIQGGILSNRMEYITHQKDSNEYIKDRESIYAYWKKVNAYPDSSDCYRYPGKTTTSFSKSIIPDLLNAKAKVFFSIGGKDSGSGVADLIPIYFIQKNKEDYKVKIYEGLDHNYFPQLENGKPDYNNGKWGIVMNDVLDWLEGNM